VTRLPIKSSMWNAAALAAAVVLAAVGAPWLIRELRSLPPPATLAQRAGTRVATLEVDGLACEGCARAVERRLAALPGVESAAVRTLQKRAYVVCARDVHDSSLMRAVATAGPGFTARIVDR
jgi:copper chaperone CopZ